MERCRFRKSRGETSRKFFSVGGFSLVLFGSSGRIFGCERSAPIHRGALKSHIQGLLQVNERYQRLRDASVLAIK